MTAPYELTAEELIAFVRHSSSDTLFGFNLDTLLAPGPAGHPVLTELLQRTLQRLMNVTKVTVFTGRTRKDALTILGFSPHLVVGNHGAEWPCRENSRNWQMVKQCLIWRERLYDGLGHLQGIEIEFRGESIAINYLKAADPEATRFLINSAIEQLEPIPRKSGGRFAVTLLPDGALTKGEALLAAMECFASRKAVYFGADETDEEVFQLRPAKVIGIRLGNAGPNSAFFHLPSPSGLPEFLDSMLGIFETP